MGGISGLRRFADCRAVGRRVGTMPSVSVVNPKKNESCHLEHDFDSMSNRINRMWTPCPRNITRVKSDIEELRWN